MKLKRVYFSKSSEEDRREEEMKKKDPDYLSKKGVVAGLATAGVGTGGYFIARGLNKIGIKDKTAQKFKAGSKLATLAGGTLAGYSLYRLHRDKKRRNDNKA